MEGERGEGRGERNEGDELSNPLLAFSPPPPISSAAPSPHFRPAVLDARARLAEGREKLRRRHDKGLPGIQTASALSKVVEEVVVSLFEGAIAAEGGSPETQAGLALVAHSGFGRRDMAPFSDVDLMLLHTPVKAGAVATHASRLMRDLYDVGLDVGHSVRTPADACGLAKQDPVIWSSLTESRLLVGDGELYAEFERLFQQRTKRSRRPILAAIDAARSQERRQFGETVYLLEPNVKRSRGTLRDIQLLRWFGFARFGATDLDGLALYGAITREDHQTLLAALEFLLRIRHELHFHAGRAADVLDRQEQLRIAAAMGYAGDVGLLPVEQFMREYFRHTTAVSHIVARFMAKTEPGSRWRDFVAYLGSSRFEPDYRIGRTQIWVDQAGLERVRADLGAVLRLLELASHSDLQVAPATAEAIFSAARAMDATPTPDVCRKFMELLSHSSRLGEMLRLLHEAELLERIIPAFAHARCLLQFNEYHKFTVDEHSLRAVERATDFSQERGTLGDVYRGIKDKALLHLALLIHDLGKGYPEDHSEVGLRIATETAARLGLSTRETEILQFLVHKHLMMSALAFFRDIDDPAVVLKFAVDVGSPEALQMLYVLTASDVDAVGPGAWTEWKADSLFRLYYATLPHLAAGGGPRPADAQARLRADVLARLGPDDDADWFRRQVALLPPAYLQSHAPDEIAADLRRLIDLPVGEALAAGRYLPATRTVEYSLRTREDVAPGIFHKLAGALSAKGLEILSAEINTLGDGLVLDRFQVRDRDFADEPPAGRIDEVCRAMVQSLRAGFDGTGPSRSRRWGAGRDSGSLSILPTKVRIDNNTSDRFTIVDVFATNRMGLLHSISRKLFEIGLSVSLAKIATHHDQVVDVFYVTDQAGGKIQDEARLQTIRIELLGAIRDLEIAEAEPATAGSR